MNAAVPLADHESPLEDPPVKVQPAEAQPAQIAVAARMLRVGERSGNMGEMTERIAAFYDEEIARWVAIVTRLIEPLFMTLIGLLIGVIVVLMYFPIFQLAGSVQ